MSRTSLEDQRRQGEAMREAALRGWMKDHELQKEAKSKLIEMRVSQMVEEINRGVDPDSAARRMLNDLG